MFLYTYILYYIERSSIQVHFHMFNSRLAGVQKLTHDINPFQFSCTIREHDDTLCMSASKSTYKTAGGGGDSQAHSMTRRRILQAIQAERVLRLFGDYGRVGQHLQFIEVERVETGS